MKQFGLLLILPFVLALSCGTAPESQDPELPPALPAESSTVSREEPAVSPEPVQTAEPEAPAEPVVQVEEKTFDPHSITEEMFTNTKAEVQTLIGDLNRIIRGRNYNRWAGYIAPSYLETISSAAFLEEKTEELYRRDQTVAQNLGRDPKRVQKKILRTAKDYFDNVVVPSRSNDRMDDIDFISETEVRAYTIDSRGNRVILYDLELIDKKWMIIN